MEYFVNFPTTTYTNTVCIDITRRVGVIDAVAKSPYAYAPYDVKDGERADTVADLYYGDASREWIVFLSTGMIDPYGQWLSSQATLERYIADTYGSILTAQQLTHHYELNWGGNDVALSPYDFTLLSDDVKSLYAPVFDNTASGNIVKYQIRRDDVRYSTNLIMTVEIDNNIFVDGDYITFGSNGHAEVCWVGNNAIKIQHVENNEYLANNVITQTSTGLTANVISTTFTCNTIPVDLRGMFSPVSYYDFEFAKNEALRTVRLLDKKYTAEIEKEMATVLR